MFHQPYPTLRVQTVAYKYNSSGGGGIRATTINSLISINCLHSFDTKPAMLFPVLTLVLRRAVLDQLAFTTNLPTYRRASRVRAPFPTRGGALATFPNRRSLRERNVAIDPIAHLTCPNTPKGPALAAPLECEHGRAVEAMPRESYHFTVLGATRVGTARWEIEENVGRGDEDRMGEENLRVGGRLVREEHYERRTSLVQDCAEDEVDLGEAGRASLVL